MKLRHVVITSVDRDDLPDGGAKQFAECIRSIRSQNSSICIEILVPDFKKNMKRSLQALQTASPDVFNHNIESVPRLYRVIKPGADYASSLQLLETFKQHHPHVPTKSGLMLGLGERKNEVLSVMRDLYSRGVTMLTIGQYLAPSSTHLPVARYVHLDEFRTLKHEALSIGFSCVFSGPLVRSSYHAEKQRSM